MNRENGFHREWIREYLTALHSQGSVGTKSYAYINANSANFDTFNFLLISYKGAGNGGTRWKQYNTS
jgi:hypothetical protein